MNQPKITIMCGLPRSGKSTWVAQNKMDEVIVSADNIRQLVYGQRFFQGGEPIMWAVRGLMLEYLMQQGLDIIVDETNTTLERRGAIIKLAKKYNYYIIGNIIECTPDLCKTRAVYSIQEDLISIIDYMSKQFEFPSISEGFDDLYRISFYDGVAYAEPYS